MASVKIEVRNEGRGQHEWDYQSQGEERIVSFLIKERSKIKADAEPIICTYVDLDRLIQTAPLSPIERMTVLYLMHGYSMSDIADKFERTRQTFEVSFRRAVKKLCKCNDQLWLSTQSARNK